MEIDNKERGIAGWDMDIFTVYTDIIMGGTSTHTHTHIYIGGIYIKGIYREEGEITRAMERFCM